MLDQDIRDESVPYVSEALGGESAEEETNPVLETNPSANSWFAEIGRWRGAVVK